LLTFMGNLSVCSVWQFKCHLEAKKMRIIMIVGDGRAEIDKPEKIGG
jgi:hypothetical protein